MDTQALERTIGDLTATLGDPTRRGIYLWVRTAEQPVTVAQVAERFDIHPNVARHHLDRLTAEGYLAVERRRPSGRKGPGAGRPAKCYVATDKEIDLHLPVRRHDLLAELLVQIIERIAPENLSEIACEVGESFGRRLADELGTPDRRSLRATMEAIAEAMGKVGFDIAPDGSGRRLVTAHCPFGSTATDHPDVVCALDRGIMSGLMGALHARRRTIELIPHDGATDHCIAEV